MPSADLLEPGLQVRRARRFGVAWRNRPRRLIAPVGVLDQDPDGYRFQYLGSVDHVPGFRPFIGFPDLGRTYGSPRLWPFFGLRVMDRKRPDYETYLRWLGLPPDAAQLDVLSRSGGEQKGDSVYMAEEPGVADDGSTHSVFLVRGSSYAVHAFGTADVANALAPEDALELVDDSRNEANPAALLLSTDRGPVGWVPDLLIDYARTVRDGGGSVSVMQNNGLDAPWHVRFLVRISGQVEPGLQIFSRPPWPTGHASRLP
jgi:hypothetical protein